LSPVLVVIVIRASVPVSPQEGVLKNIVADRTAHRQSVVTGRWHTFRHTYRSWLDETGAPLKVQQELMRHASIQTTMNVYGQAMSSSKREANGKVVEMVLKPTKASA
jgi:integrase